LTKYSSHLYFVPRSINKRKRKPKEQSRMDNPETLTTSGTQDTRRRQLKKHTTQKTE